MWVIQIIPIIACIRTSFPLPQNDNLDDLLINVFGRNPNMQQQNNTAPNILPSKVPQNMGLSALIDEVFNANTTGMNKGDKITGDEVSSVNDDQSLLTNDCECVPYYQCQNNSIVDDGVGLIDIRIRGVCENYLDICCKRPNILEPNNRVTPKPIVWQGCGQRQADGVGFRITGQIDNEAQFGEFPWMVAILREEGMYQNGQNLNVYQCGGSLIHSQAILTAAHCVNGKSSNQLKVRVGEWDTQTKNEPFPHQDRDVIKVIIHPNFHSGSLRNDFAILILSEPVQFAENVNVICLPKKDDIFDGARCFASGWGKDTFGKEGHYQVILKRVELPVVNHNICQDWLRSTRLGKYYVLHTSFLCAGGETGKDTCKGDGGSPLVCPLQNDPERYAQAGIVAWGIGCGENGIPGVYSNVANARQWIDEQLFGNNLN
ncbi:phenoloxidase-activating factor 2-like isoform X2 [Microplitis mediator]|uniref:phenoloxidase-activating factor 2-like isoform X2 n=1 Tax=Microplitis mediator TaxID=375433 RepID=UPI002552C03A|nr:phenoloxidase-activating factor 2-like isoform X2 [Microplitis mediator]